MPVFSTLIGNIFLLVDMDYGGYLLSYIYKNIYFIYIRIQFPKTAEKSASIR